jgi:predicted component of type VI protein secretion system
MQTSDSKKPRPAAKPALKSVSKPVLKPEIKPASETKPRAATKVTTGSFPEAPPATKFATAAAIEPPPIYVEQPSREDEHAEAIQQLAAEVEALKLNAAGMQQAMDQKMKLYIKMLIGGMSLLGMFDIFR